MSLAFVSIQDARDIRTWSGIPYYAREALQQHFGALELVTPLDFQSNFWMRRKIRRYNRSNPREKFYAHYQPLALKQYARAALDALDARSPDPVFSIFPDPLVEAEGMERPWVFYTDATFATLERTYPALSNLCEESRQAGHRLWQKACKRVDVACFASEWAAESAINDYGADPKKVRVIPIGANLNTVPDRDSVLAAAAQRERDHLRLFWMGVDWERKGGDVALQLLQRLREQGLPATLTLVGCEPPPSTVIPEGVEVAGFLRKDQPEQAERLEALFQSAHFFVLPTQAEAFGLVFGESSAYALPSLATRLGGVPTVIKDDVNGYLYEPEAFVEGAAETIRRLFSDAEAYNTLCIKARDRFEEALSWDAFTRKFAEIVAQNGWLTGSAAAEAPANTTPPPGHG